MRPRKAITAESVDAGPACDQLIAELTRHGHDDDIALIHVRNTGRPGLVARPARTTASPTTGWWRRRGA